MWPLKEDATPGATSAPDMIMARFLDIAAPGGRSSKKSSDLMGGGSLMQVRPVTRPTVLFPRATALASCCACGCHPTRL